MIIQYNVLRTTNQTHEKRTKNEQKNSKKSSHKNESCSYNILRKQKGDVNYDEKCRNYSELQN